MWPKYWGGVRNNHIHSSNPPPHEPKGQWLVAEPASIEEQLRRTGVEGEECSGIRSRVEDPLCLDSSERSVFFSPPPEAIDYDVAQL